MLSLPTPAGSESPSGIVKLLVPWEEVSGEGRGVSSFHPH